MQRSGPPAIVWVIAAIMVLMVGGIAATIAISVHHGVSSGYIPPDQR